MKITIYKYIDPNTKENYLTLKEPWDDIYDGEWKWKGDERVVEVFIKYDENYL